MNHLTNRTYRPKSRIWGCRNRRNAFCREVTKNPNPYLNSSGAKPASAETGNNTSSGLKPTTLYDKYGRSLVILPDGTVAAYSDELGKPEGPYVGTITQEGSKLLKVLLEHK